MMSGVSPWYRICFRVRADTFGKQHWEDQDHRESATTQAQAEGERVKGGVATYLVQVIDKPDQMTVLEVRYTLLILFPIKHVAELIMKLG